MNQKGFVVPLVIAIVVLAVVGVGAAIYFNQTEDQSAAEVATESEIATEMSLESEDTTETDSTSFTGTIGDLLKNGRNLTCAFDQADNGAAVDGQIFVAGQGQRIRGDFTLIQPDNVPINAHIVRDGGFNYFWSDEMPQGTKFPVDERETAEPKDGARQEVLDETFNYNCRPWVVTPSVFDLPADKEFVDISQQINQINSATEEVQQAQCSACNQLAGSARTQCLQALGC